MRLRLGLALFVVLSAVGICVTASSTGGVLIGLGSFVQHPTSALYALIQMSGDAAALPTATPAATTPPTIASNGATPSEATTTDATPTPTPVDVSELLGAIALIPDTGVPEGTGGVIEQYYPNGAGDTYIELAAGTLRNMTAVDTDSLIAEIEKGMPFEIELNSDEPQVLIMHTHATETYRLYEGLYYDLDSTARTTDITYSVCAVGAIMAQTLNDAGIYTLHDTTLNDYPSYNDSYDNSYDVVAAYLAQYPSIKVVIDVHRDALGDDENWYAPVSEINGTQAAQVMIIAGCDNGSTISLPNCLENLRFAAAWQAEMEGTYPGLTRSAMFNYKYYNQDLTTGSLLIEVGGHGNTLNEALYAGQMAAESLVQVLAGGRCASPNCQL